MRIKVKRESLIPVGAAKVVDKASDAVAFVYTTPKGKPAAVGFSGKRAKPDWHHSFADEGSRERAVMRHFEACRAAGARKAEHRGAANGPHGLEIGHVLVASWGYDQTNVDYYQVTALVGRCMVEVRPIGSADAGTGREPWATGKSVPAPDAFKGETIRRRVHGQRRTVRIDECRTARVWDGRPASWTAYA